MPVIQIPCPIWIALDMPDFTLALKVVEQTKRFVHGFKVHASTEDDLFAKAQRLRAAGASKLWWDRKAHDIPDTVSGIVTTARNSGFDRITVHSSGGIEMMMAAMNAASDDLEIIAITMLTSLSAAEVGMQTGMPTESAVLLRAQWAAMAGVHGVVASGKEAGLLHSRRQFSSVAGRHLELANLKIVVPGTRTISEEMGSQQRSTSAQEALFAGADELVLGSEIWKHEDPAGRLEKIYRLIEVSRQPQ